MAKMRNRSMKEPTESIEQRQRKQRAHGENWHKARHLYLKYPFVPVTDLARIFGVSRKRFNEYVADILDGRKQRCEEELARIKAKEGL
jgi:hypothetical protein